MAARLVEVATTALAAIDAASWQADADDFVHSILRKHQQPRWHCIETENIDKSINKFIET